MENYQKMIDNIFETMPLIHKKLMAVVQSEGFHHNRMNVLFLIKNHASQPMKFYGKKLMMNKSNFSNLVEDMIEEGLIKKMENSDDRRQYLLMLTEQGEVFLENCRKSINQKFWEQIKDMDPEELDKLNESFKEIRRIFESI